MDAEESARRVRAAWAYSLLEQAELAERSGLHPDRLRKLLGKKKPDRATFEERQAIAEACKVPETFMAAGFAEEPAITGRLQNLETQLATLVAGFSRLDERVRLLEARRSADAVEEHARSEASQSATVPPRPQQRR